MRTIKIISGGQTGVDRAALDAAMDLGIACGGWCPKGRLAEDGPIDPKYPLTELQTASYDDRTLKNVLESDGTLVIYFAKLIGGTRLTVSFLKSRQKPFIAVDAARTSTMIALNLLEGFVAENRIRTLNVAGPRARSNPKAYFYTYGLLSRWLKEANREEGS